MATRLYSKNLEQYIKDTYNIENPKLSAAHTIPSIKPLLQRNYGGTNDCAITSITCAVCYEFPKASIEGTYEVVEKWGKRFFFRNKWGTPNMFIHHIYNIVLREFGSKRKIKGRFFKGFGCRFKKIQTAIDSNSPVLICTKNDGRDYYTEHCVTIIGYKIYDDKIFLEVYDN